jgi:hypothetical protein
VDCRLPDISSICDAILFLKDKRNDATLYHAVSFQNKIADSEQDRCINKMIKQCREDKPIRL